MLRCSRLALAAIGCLALTTSARAGEFALEGQGGAFDMAAQNTAVAVYGSARASTFGGALRYTAWRGAFVSAGLRTFSKDGERVFVEDPSGPVQHLGFPLTMKTNLFIMTLGYRLRDGRLIVPYAHAGLARASYKVTSEVADEPFHEDISKTGLTGGVGVEAGRSWIRLGVELGYTRLPNAIGAGGVSQVYGESDIGGLHVIGKLALAIRGL